MKVMGVCMGVNKLNNMGVLARHLPGHICDQRVKTGHFESGLSGAHHQYRDQ